VRYALPRIAVDDTIALLFSEGHSLEVECSDREVIDNLKDVIKETWLNQVMVESATFGGIESPETCPGGLLVLVHAGPAECRLTRELN
jgi:hypothetical protein